MKKTVFILFLFLIGVCVQSCKTVEKESITNGLITYYSNQNGKDNIFIMHPDGSEQQILVNDGYENTNGVWSPDRKNMIFTSEREGNKEIYIIDAYGNNEKRLTNNNSADDYHGWSPDSKQIIYVSNEDGNQEIYIMDVNGENKRNITNSESNEMYPCLSPNGNTILFCAAENESWKIYEMDINGEHKKKVTQYSGPNWELYPQFSPDGKKIAYFTHTSENEIRNIFVMDHLGKNPVQLTNSDFVDENPFWSPDGEWIVFQSNRTGNFQIYKMKADGTQQIWLSKNNNNEYCPSWTWIKEN